MSDQRWERETEKERTKEKRNGRTTIMSNHTSNLPTDDAVSVKIKHFCTTRS
jgi:hypothetical protein